MPTAPSSRPTTLFGKTTFGSTTDLRADGNQNSIVDAADYTIWRDNLGATVPAVASIAAPVSILATTSQLAETKFATAWPLTLKTSVELTAHTVDRTFELLEEDLTFPIPPPIDGRLTVSKASQQLSMIDVVFSELSWGRTGRTVRLRR